MADFKPVIGYLALASRVGSLRFTLDEPTRLSQGIVRSEAPDAGRQRQIPNHRLEIGHVPADRARAFQERSAR